MSEQLLDFNPATGMKTWFSSSEDDGGTWQVRYEQDTAPILDQNKSAQADGFDRRGDMWHAAKVPTVVLMEWVVKHGVRAWDKNHAPAVRRLLDSNEYRYLRVNHFMMGR